jgi:hypothetical protein
MPATPTRRSPHPVARRLLTLGAAALVAIAAAPAAAAAKAPAPALGTVRTAAPVAATGYGAGPAFSNWASPDPYTLGSDGKQLLVAGTQSGVLRLSAWDPAKSRQLWKRSLVLAPLKVGAVLPASDGFVYVLVGRDNPTESTTDSVIELRKYTQDLKLVGTAAVSGGFDGNGIFSSFEATASSIAQSGGTVIVHTARLIFHIPGDSAPHHQVNLSFAVDTGPMTARPVIGPYASHSFRQFVRIRGADVLFADHGDAFPRGIQVGFLAGGLAAPANGVFARPVNSIAKVFPGDIGDNDTGATLNGFEVGTTHALTTGLVRLPNVADTATRNVFLTSTDLAAGTSTERAVTRSFAPADAKSAIGQPQLVPVGGGRFAVIFAVGTGAMSAVRYELVDQTGAAQASRTWKQPFVPLGQPITIGKRVFWVGTDGKPAKAGKVNQYLFGLDVANPAKPKALTKRR